jgi:hypothetical protein
MKLTHPKTPNKPHSMGHPSASSSAPPHPTLNHQKLHPTAKTLKPNTPTPKSATIPSSSSGEEEDNAPQGNRNDWQQIHRKKRIRTSNSQPTLQIPQTPIQNRYEMLIDGPPNTAQAENTQPPKIFLHGVIDYDKMVRIMNEVAETEQFYAKSMANNVIKITCLTPETYRTLIKHFKVTNLFYHTYQLKEERAF